MRAEGDKRATRERKALGGRRNTAARTAVVERLRG